MSYLESNSAILLFGGRLVLSGSPGTNTIGMNATSISATHLTGEGSDLDANPDDSLEYYQPISAVDVDDDDGDSNQANSDEEHHRRSYHVHETQNGFSSLHLNGDDADAGGKSSGEEEEDEEERLGEASDSAISGAFREDESRRNAPLTAENALRVMEAMRGVSFGGLAPDWAGRIPEDQWIDRLRRLRQPPRPPSAAAAQD